MLLQRTLGHPNIQQTEAYAQLASGFNAVHSALIR